MLSFLRIVGLMVLATTNTILASSRRAATLLVATLCVQGGASQAAETAERPALPGRRRVSTTLRSPTPAWCCE